VRLASVLLVLATPAFAEPQNPYLNQAKEFQQQLDFEKCLHRLEQASRWANNTKPQLAQIELYSGLCEAGLGHETEAFEHFELGFALDRDLELPPQQGPKITALFRKAKDKAPPPEEPVAPLKTPPPEPPPALVPAEPAPTPPAVIVEPAKPVHLGAPLGIFIAGAAVAGVGGVFGGLALGSKNKGLAEHYESDQVIDLQLAQTEALVANILFSVAGAALIAALITYFALN
jgi:hypothetical protein